jgi:hypothetical protein
MTNVEQSAGSAAGTLGSEAGTLEGFNKQFLALTKQMISNLRERPAPGEHRATLLLIIAGGFLLFVSLAMKLEYVKAENLRPEEFITLIVSSSVLMLVGALFSLYQARSWRKIIKLQQAAGIEILNKQIDAEKDLLAGRQRQWGQLTILPVKIHKRLRR